MSRQTGIDFLSFWIFSGYSGIHGGNRWISGPDGFLDRRRALRDYHQLLPGQFAVIGGSGSTLCLLIALSFFPAKRATGSWLILRFP